MLKALESLSVSVPLVQTTSTVDWDCCPADLEFVIKRDDNSAKMPLPWGAALLRKIVLVMVRTEP
jgi:hypothetical protein